MKNIPHLVRITAHFICVDCGDNTQINVPEEGTNERSYCCNATYRAYVNDAGETVVERVKAKRKKQEKQSKRSKALDIKY